MKFRQLGRTGLRISEIGFGCWAIGGSGYGVTDDRESLDALAAAWEHGVNFLIRPIRMATGIAKSCSPVF